ncbi:hypothetical protein ANANG_G00290880 [Anguilla anguilla]|uniref:Lethal giant larvae homologue 2 domain-containing protein n=1 Tax=Anguilla anguilla TaxID=7936 RepID=A0A9D3LL20_ANGAN|nr:hypothetical protein ANANG_G00290880 [Anguilla anguilla]
MMKFRFRRQGNDPQREKIKQDLFAFSKMVEHGFPSQPSALAYDHMLQLMAIGTKSGAVKVYGKPGVEFIGAHKETAAITQMHFLPGQGRLVSLLDDNTLHLWEVRQTETRSHLEESRGFVFPGRPGLNATSSARVTVLLVKGSCDLLCLGTEGGGVHFLELPQLQPSGAGSLFPEEIMQSVPEDYRCGKSLGPVESLQEHPLCTGKILIGYSRGLLVLWDLHTRCVDSLFLGNQQLESVCWESGGEVLVSSHSDGTYAVWAVDDTSPCTQQPVSSVTPYGSFPCKAISKILWRRTESGAPLVLFSGGMPRASYGDRHCVTLLQENTQVALDFTSRVIDFFTVHNTDSNKSFDDPTALVVLLEEELVVIDLQTTGWPTIPCPYLAPLHSSAITCSYHVSNVPSKLWERIIRAGLLQCPTLPEGKWPISGGNNLAADPQQQELLLTGHEDGTVRFWDASQVSLKLLYTLRTASVFHTDGDHGDGDHGDGLSQTGRSRGHPSGRWDLLTPIVMTPGWEYRKCVCVNTAADWWWLGQQARFW